jgi:hypothetical protein
MQIERRPLVGWHLVDGRRKEATASIVHKAQAVIKCGGRSD